MDIYVFPICVFTLLNFNVVLYENRFSTVFFFYHFFSRYRCSVRVSVYRCGVVLIRIVIVVIVVASR